MVRRLGVALLLLMAGCRHGTDCARRQVEAHVVEIASLHWPVDDVPGTEPVPALQGPADLHTLWQLALAQNPALRQAAAEVEAARGQQIQAGLYPNPVFNYNEEGLGERGGPGGTLFLQVRQEIVTAGKLELDVSIAKRAADGAYLALLARKFEVLTRVRRAYRDVQALAYAAKINDAIVGDLQRAVAITKRQVEETKARPATDLIRMQTLLGDALLQQQTNRVNLKAAWGVVAAEIGAPELPMPSQVGPLPAVSPRWEEAVVKARTLAASAQRKQALVEVDKARLQVERARVAAIPNVTVGGGYWHDFATASPGAVVNVALPIPVFDKKQGLIHEAQARQVQALAALGTIETRLSARTAEAYGRYLGARQQVEQLGQEIIPGLEKNLSGVREAYQAAVPRVAFADVLLAEQSLNSARLRMAESLRDLWRAVADLQGLMQLDLDEEPSAPRGGENRRLTWQFRQSFALLLRLDYKKD
jgi:cobalt-zinc-cadmium efflux system outer membrane protein